MIIALLLLLATVTMNAQSQTSVDMVLVNGTVWTVNDRQPSAEAVACSNGRIFAVGSSAEIRTLAGPSTRVIDLKGRLVLPGFNDAHVHFYAGGAHLNSVTLRDAASPSEFRERIRAYAKQIPKGRWITGGDWDHERWEPAQLPTRALIDDVTPDNPVSINRLDGHMSLVNSQVLRLAGITRETPDPPGGTIVRDERGEPTGILKDAAMDAVDRITPDASHDEILENIRSALRYAAENGVTSVQDMSAGTDVLAAYQELLARNDLTVRIYGYQPLGMWKTLAAVGIRAGFGGPMLKIGGLKGFADGSLGSTTALFFEPYLDAPGTSGLPSEEMIPEQKMLDNILGADRAGMQIAIHAIGDRANQIVLTMFDSVAHANGARDRRLRIEHAQHLRPQEITAFARQKVIASMQPYHAIDDGRWADKRIGMARAKGTYAFRSLLDAGAILAFGSDWYVAPMEPIQGIYAAVTRRTLDGKRPDGWVPEQKITVAQAIYAYTMGSAFAAFDESTKGSVEPGKVADLVVLSENILRIPPERIHDAKVMMTIVDGRIVFDREARP